MFTKPLRGAMLNRSHPLARGLVGCWLFNEGVGNKAYDLSGCGNHGTLENMAFPPTTASGWNPGKDGVGLNFDGSGDYVDCGNGPSLDITDTITIEAWVNPTNLGVPYNYIVSFDKQSGEGINDQYSFNIEGDDLWFGDNIGLGEVVDCISVNKWFHLAVTYNGNNNISGIKIYVDGISQTVSEVGTFDGLEATTDPEFSIGARRIDGSAAHVFNGAIDGVKIYNRALSAQEIQQLYMYPYAMFEPATKYTIIGEALRTKHVGTNVAAAELLR